MKKLMFVISVLLFSIFVINDISAQLRYDDMPEEKNNDWVSSGQRYNKRDINYYFESFTTDLTQAQQKQAIKDAFDIWCLFTPLTYKEVFNPSEADIIFKWATGDHGDVNLCCSGNCSFDGQNGKLAHAMYPYFPYNSCMYGDVHFDDDETWTISTRNSSAQPIDLVTVAAHEIGHSLGLGHSANTFALMYADYNGSHRSLNADDAAGIKSIYNTTVADITSLSSQTISIEKNYKYTVSLIAHTNYIVDNGGNVSFTCPSIGLLNGFSVNEGGKFIANSDMNCGLGQNNFDKIIVPNVVFNTDSKINLIIPDDFSLSQNYPNPFNPSTLIQYGLKENVSVKITVYDILGRVVKTLVNDFQDAGYKSVVWDGTNNFGSSVATGLYIYKIEAGNFVDSKKMLLLK